VTVTRNPAGTIVLTGDCPVEDAETLLQLLQASPTAPLDWAQSRELHTAVMQVILAVRPVVTGPCGNAWVAKWVELGAPAR
jgi:hypothetical protein